MASSEPTAMDAPVKDGMTPEEMRAYMAEHNVLPLIHQSLNTAVRAQATNPLLHMARTLRSRATSRRAAASRKEQLPRTADAAAEPTEAYDTAVASQQPLTTSDGSRLNRISDVHTEEQLREVLASNGVDLSSWGVAGAHSVTQLLAELRKGESVLCRLEKGGTLRLVIKYVEVALRHRGRLLVLTHEEVDGHARRKFELLRAVLRVDEDGWRRTAQLAVSTLLRAAEPSGAAALSALRWHEETRRTERGEALSASYPGLMCEYTCEYVEASMPVQPPSELGGAAPERFFTRAALPPQRGAEQARVLAASSSSSSSSSSSRAGSSHAPISSNSPISPISPACGAIGAPASRRKLHWAWYPLREWETILRKKENEARARKAEASRRATDAPGEFRVSRASPPCAACKCSPRRHNPSPHR